VKEKGSAAETKGRDQERKKRRGKVVSSCILKKGVQVAEAPTLSGVKSGISDVS